ncbi:MAG: nfdA 3 [Acidobacteria bacterium]|jgi:predicted amidohydrolase YtcJ|nr:nfdA 3 [Acidobacteriota bacterium]
MTDYLLRAFFLLVVFCSAAASQSLPADIVIINAKVRTMDAAKPQAEAVAVMGNKIVAVGSNAEIRALAGTRTKTIDAKGKTVLPGFNDAHVHFLEGGFQLSSVDLRDAKTPQEFVERIKNFAAKLPKGRWILGGKWDHENWTPNNLPTKELIDAATPDNPVFIDRLDGHMALANSLALKLAGVDKNTKEVEGGLIVRDAGGNPTGVLKDAAMGYVNKVIPGFSFEQKLEAAIAATEYAASLGVTSVQDMSAGNEVGVYQELLRQGKLKTRIYAVSPLSDFVRWERTGIHFAFGDAMLRVGGLKGYSDGSLGSTTAWFFEPYLDAPNTTGLPSDEIPKMYENVKGADKSGLQVMVHAIGDKANDTMLSTFERVAKENGERDRRFRIEHAQHLRIDDLKRFGALKIVASMQPFHLADDGRWAHKRLDEKRLKGTYAFRTILDSGGALAFGTDWAVAPLNPLLGVHAAVTRQTLDGKNPNGWIPEQKISLEETLRAYTAGSAYAEFQENVKGTISTGKLADLIILSDDIFTINPNEINKTKVLLTIGDGKVIYESK